MNGHAKTSKSLEKFQATPLYDHGLHNFLNLYMTLLQQYTEYQTKSPLGKNAQDRVPITT